MRGVFRIVYSEIRGLHQSAYILAIFSLGSQILALVRDRLFAHTFGAGTELDIYYTAFKIPDLLFVLFASMLSVYVLIPFVTQRIEAGSRPSAQKLLSNVLSVFVGVYVVCALVVCIFADSLSSLLFPGFIGEDHALLTMMIRILLLQPLLLGISSLFGVVTQLYQRFILYAMSPVLYNLGIIGGVLFLYPTLGLAGVGWGVVIGALLHVGIQIPFMRARDIAPRLTLGIDWNSMKQVLMHSVPRALTLSLNQLVLLVFAGVASLMAIGSVSIFQFAFNLQSVFLVIIGVSYSVAAFPILAELFMKGSHQEFLERVTATLRHIIFWMVPAIVLIVVLRAQLVRVILGSGAFDWNDTRLTAAALAILACSLVAQATTLLIIRAFYAGGNTRTPFVITLVSSAGSVVLSLGFYAAFLAYPVFAETMETLLRVKGAVGSEVLMLALGYSLAQVLYSLWLLGAFVRGYGLPLLPLVGTALRALVSAALGGVVAYSMLLVSVSVFETEILWGILAQGALAGITGLFAIVFALALLKSPELKELWMSIVKRMGRAGVPATDTSSTLSP